MAEWQSHVEILLMAFKAWWSILWSFLRKTFHLHLFLYFWVWFFFYQTAITYDSEMKPLHTKAISLPEYQMLETKTEESQHIHSLLKNAGKQCVRSYYWKQNAGLYNRAWCDDLARQFLR